MGRKRRGRKRRRKMVSHFTPKDRNFRVNQRDLNLNKFCIEISLLDFKKNKFCSLQN